MRLAVALLVSLGAHLAVLWYAGSLAGAPASAASGGTAPATAFRAWLVVEPPPEPPAAVAENRQVRRLPVPKRYLPASELDARPQIRNHVMPEYPKGTLSGTRGRVVLQLFIATDGTLDAVRVEQARPQGVFDEAAVKAFSKARFSPGMKRGVAVPSLVRIEVNFGD